MNEQFKRVYEKSHLTEASKKTIVEDINNGVEVNKIFQQWDNIKTKKQQDAFTKKVVDIKFGTYGQLNILDIIAKFNRGNANEVSIEAFIKEVKQAYKQTGLKENKREDQIDNFHYTQDLLYDKQRSYLTGYGIKLIKTVDGFKVVGDGTKHTGYIKLKHITNSSDHYRVYVKINLGSHGVQINNQFSFSNTEGHLETKGKFVARFYMNLERILEKM